MTLSDELDLVNSLLERAAASGTAEWQEGQHRVKRYSLKELLDWKRQLEQRIDQAGNPLTMPIREVNL